MSRPEVREIYESLWGVTIQAEPGLRIPNMFDAAIGGSFKGLYVQGEDIAQSDPNTQHVEAALRSMELVVVHDLFLNETARFAHVFLPGASFLEKDGTFTNAERRINRVRPVMPSRVGKDEWQVVCEIATAMGYPMSYDAPSQIMDEIAATTPTFAGVSFARLDAEGSMQWPVTEAAPHGTPTMHVGSFVRGLGQLTADGLRADHRAGQPALPAGAHDRAHPVAVQRRRPDPAHPQLHLAPRGRPRDPPVRRRAARGRVRRRRRAVVAGRARRGSPPLVSERMPAGVVYTTFHHPVTGANVVTTENSDWATNCPEYKVTAVQVEVVTEAARAEATAAERVPDEVMVAATEAMARRR